MSRLHDLIQHPLTSRPQVLNTINVLRNEGMLMELKCDDPEERFRTRVLYAAHPDELSQCNAEMADACQVTPHSHCPPHSLPLGYLWDIGISTHKNMCRTPGSS